MKQELLQKELAEINKLKAMAAISLKDAPEGKLWASMHKGKHPQYYLCEEQDGKSKKKYIKRKDMDMVRKLAQKEYDVSFLQAVTQQENAIQQFLESYQEDKLVQVYSKLPETKKLVVTPYVLSDEQYIEQWYSKTKSNSNPYPIENEHITEKKEFVRSKSEKMIADKLFYMNIPYKYEAPLLVGRNREIYPDFTLLDIRHRRNVYLEHFGMMDNPDYCKKAIEKIELYESLGITMGDNLIITMESSLKSINMQHFEKMIKRRLELK